MFLTCIPAVGEHVAVTATTDDPARALASLGAAQVEHPSAFLAEVLIPGADPRTAIPGELARAIDAWNAMTDRVNVHIDKVKSRAQYVVPYRKWVKAAGRRDYFLEQLIADVETQPYIWPTIRFGWLLRSARTKDGELNSEKIHARAFGKVGNGNGQATPSDTYGSKLIAASTCRCTHLSMSHSCFTGPCEDCKCERFNGGANV